MAGAVSQFEHDRKQIAKLARLSEYWEEQFQQSAAARETEARAAKIAQTEVFMAAQTVVFQRRDEQEARAAAEERAADLEEELSAQQTQIDSLEDQCRRISADKDEVAERCEALLNAEREARTAAESRVAALELKLEAESLRTEELVGENRRISAKNAQVSRDFQAALLALGDLDLSASQACSEEVQSKLSSARWKVACSREWNCQDAMSLPCALPSSLHTIQR